MKVLFLDDEGWRHDGMDVMLPSGSVTHAYSLAWFRDILAMGQQFDLVCFDHDLGPDENGQDAARAFVASGHPKTKCLVHSWNPHGSLRIADILREGGHVVIVAQFSTALKALFDSLGEAA